MKYVLVYESSYDDEGYDSRSNVSKFTDFSEMTEFVNKQKQENAYFEVLFCGMYNQEFDLKPVEKITKFELTPR